MYMFNKLSPPPQKKTYKSLPPRMKTLQQRWLNTMLNLNVLTFLIFGPKQGCVNLGDQNRGGVFPFLLIEAHTHCFLASISIPIVQVFLSGS